MRAVHLNLKRKLCARCVSRADPAMIATSIIIE
jgi:hypothetical protein